MKLLLTSGRLLAASLLLGVFAPVAAQSLGNLRAEAWIGRALDVTVPARFAPGEDRVECVQAQVFYGDQRLPANQVQASLLGLPGERRVRIVADAAINEPVVTLSVRAGCGNTITRVYTLLPGMASEQVLAAAASRSAGAASASAQASPVRAAVTTAIALRPARESARPAPPRARAASPQRSRDASGGGTPRLRLEMWEPEPTTFLRVSAQLTEPSGNAAQRAAAALLWQALSADPSELLRMGAALQRLEGELAQLRTTAELTRAEMTALRQAVEAPPEGFQLPGQLAQVLMLLLLAGAAAGAFLWWRNARQQHLGDWYAAPLATTPDGAPPQEPQQGTPFAVARRHMQEEPANEPAIGQPQPARAGGLAAERVDAVPAAAELPPAADPVEFEFALAPPQSAAPGPRSLLRVETLAATFQEVEFLSSLGLWGDAADVLKAYLEDSSAPAPIAFFELMRLYLHDENPAGETAVRRRYSRVFGAEAPPQAQFTAPLGLQARGELAARITRSWGKPQALDMIEELLFAVPAPDQALSLEAGRELLCLYQVALEIEREGSTSRDHADAEQGLAPWAHAEDAAQAQAAAQAAAEDRGGDSFALDLDLNAAAAAEEPQPGGGNGLALGHPEPGEEAEDPLLREFAAALDRSDAARRAAQEAEQDAFSAAVASESRRPLR